MEQLKTIKCVPYKIPKDNFVYNLVKVKFDGGNNSR